MLSGNEAAAISEHLEEGAWPELGPASVGLCYYLI